MLYLKCRKKESAKMFIPKECYNAYGVDLDGCITQENEGCSKCYYRKRKEQEHTAQVKRSEANIK